MGPLDQPFSIFLFYVPGSSFSSFSSLSQISTEMTSGAKQ